jgi:hypothetical protein
MSDSKNYETTFNHFLLHFVRYLCNFCPNKFSQHAILMKVSHLGMDTLVGQGESAHTLNLAVKIQKLEFFYFYNFDYKFGFKNIILV